MPRFLSPEWLAALEARARAIDLTGIDPGAAIVVQHEVTAADGDVTYRVVLDVAGVSVHEGGVDDATVTFTADEATARAIADGELSAQAAYMEGRLRFRGDVGALRRWGPALAQLYDPAA